MCLTIDDLFPLYPSISPVSQTDRGIALCCMGCRTCLTIHDPLLLVLLLRFLVSWCILPVPFNFHFEPFGEWSIIYMFLSFSGIYLFIFIIFKFLWLRWQEKKWELFRIFVIVMFLLEEWDFFLYRNFIRAV